MALNSMLFTQWSKRDAVDTLDSEQHFVSLLSSHPHCLRQMATLSLLILEVFSVKDNLLQFQSLVSELSQHLVTF